MDWINLFHFPRRIYERLYSFCIARPSFGTCGKALNIKPSVSVTNPQYVFLGNYITINKNSVLLAIDEDRSGQSYSPHLEIGDHVYLGLQVHINCANYVKLGSGILVANNVHISDVNHGYKEIDSLPFDQPLQVGKVEIGENTWIGQGAVIVGDVKIGKHCVIGANAVVSGHFEDFSVIVGVPARTVKRYHFQKKEWLKI